MACVLLDSQSAGVDRTVDCTWGLIDFHFTPRDTAWHGWEPPAVSVLWGPGLPVMRDRTLTFRPAHRSQVPPIPVHMAAQAASHHLHRIKSLLPPHQWGSWTPNLTFAFGSSAGGW
jgi:hypothetical protein